MRLTSKTVSKKSGEDTPYIKIAKLILNFLALVNFPLYSSPYSKKTYTLHQKFVLLVIIRLEKKGYNSFPKHLKDLNCLTEFLRLKSLPAGSTLQRTAESIESSLLDKMLGMFAGKRSNLRLGIDSSGFDPNHSSNYYVNRIKYQSKKTPPKKGRPQKHKIKKSQHVTAVSDTDNQTILALKSSRGKKSDCKTLKPTFNKIKWLAGRIKSIHADKGYDAEYNFEYIKETLKAEPVISIRNENTPICRTTGKYRKQAKRKKRRKIGRPPKNHRNKTETIFSVIKRKLDPHINAVKAPMQRKEILFKALAYNALRVTR